MKKLLTVLLAMLMVLAIAGCSKKETEELVDPAPTAKNTYADYLAAPVETELEVLMSVQAHQNWWSDEGQGKVTVYGQDDDGGYLCYELFADEATANAMVPGTLIRVKGVRSEYAGEIEFGTGATCEIIAGAYDGKVYDPVDVTSLVGTDALADKMNQKVLFKGVEIVAQDDGQPINYKQSDWDHDIYFRGIVNGTTIDFCIENQLVASDADAYKAVETLQIGDVVDLEGFLYWYNAPNPHITAVSK